MAYGCRIDVRSLARWCVALLVAGVGFAWQAPAEASGDFGCAPSWKLQHRSLTGCDNVMMLSPGNDTRVNLALLIADRRRGAPAAAPLPSQAPQDPVFDWGTFSSLNYPTAPMVGDENYAGGEGSRCLSNLPGTEDFAAAVATSGIPPSEMAALIAARRGFVPSCAETKIDAAATPVTSATGRAFAAYLEGAAAFYGGDFALATSRFASLATADNAWVKETARYMLGRVEVNLAQVGAFTEFGTLRTPPGVDRAVMASAEHGLRGYLRDYPRGRYAVSARGLLRRIYWLNGDVAKLSAEYAALFDQDDETRGLDDAALANEIDLKLLPGLDATKITDPLLLAVVDLAAMREPGEGAIFKEELAAQRPLFSAAPGLYDLLQATRAFYGARDAKVVLDLIPDTGPQARYDNLAFSRQMLRGMALDAVASPDARRFWLGTLAGARQSDQRPAVELALAMHDERTGGLAPVFEPASPIQRPMLRGLLLTNVADATLLRRQAGDPKVATAERQLALFTLLYKELTRGSYRAFLTDIAMVPAGTESAKRIDERLFDDSNLSLGIFTDAVTSDDYQCPLLRETVRTLAAAPTDAGAQLCRAEFVRLNNMDGFILDRQPPRDELGGTPSLFPGKPYSRLESYKAIIADKRTAPKYLTYALHRAIRCYAPGGGNSCGGVDVALATRKAWFQRLKRDFPTSRWATSLDYYW